MKRWVSPIQVASGTVPGTRKRSHGTRAVAAADLRRTPRPCAEVTTRQPAPSAIAAVASREPASATITSRTTPAAAPATSAASVGSSARSLSCVAMTTLSMTDLPLEPAFSSALPTAGADGERQDLLARDRLPLGWLLPSKKLGRHQPPAPKAVAWHWA